MRPDNVVPVRRVAGSRGVDPSIILSAHPTSFHSYKSAIVIIGEGSHMAT